MTVDVAVAAIVAVVEAVAEAAKAAAAAAVVVVVAAAVAVAAGVTVAVAVAAAVALAATVTVAVAPAATLCQWQWPTSPFCRLLHPTFRMPSTGPTSRRPPSPGFSHRPRDHGPIPSAPATRPRRTPPLSPSVPTTPSPPPTPGPGCPRRTSLRPPTSHSMTRRASPWVCIGRRARPTATRRSCARAFRGCPPKLERYVIQSKPDVAQRHSPDLKSNRWRRLSGRRSLSVAAPDGALLTNWGNVVCCGCAALRREVPLWMPQ